MRFNFFRRAPSNPMRLSFSSFRVEFETLLTRWTSEDKFKIKSVDLIISYSMAAGHYLDTHDTILVPSIFLEKLDEFVFSLATVLEKKDFKTSKRFLREELARIDAKQTQVEKNFNSMALEMVTTSAKQMSLYAEQNRVYERNRLAMEIYRIMVTGTGVQKTAHKIHFEDLKPSDFERLCYAYLLKINNSAKIEWLGESGADGGRDIWLVDKNKTACYQCANYRNLTSAKILGDIDKLVANDTVPNKFSVIAGGSVSARLRAEIRSYAVSKGIAEVEILSGVEFEEHLRKEAPELILRFILGIPFPEANGLIS